MSKIKKQVKKKESGRKKTTKKSRKSEEKHGKSAFVDMRKALLNTRRIHGNDEKRRIAIDMLERYTGHRAQDFQKQVILTNFHYYVERFNALLGDHYYTSGSAFRASSSRSAQVTIIEFGVGSAMAALVGELIAVMSPRPFYF